MCGHADGGGSDDDRGVTAARPRMSPLLRHSQLPSFRPIRSARARVRVGCATPARLDGVAPTDAIGTLSYRATMFCQELTVLLTEISRKAGGEGNEKPRPLMGRGSNERGRRG